MKFKGNSVSPGLDTCQNNLVKKHCFEIVHGNGILRTL